MKKPFLGEKVYQKKELRFSFSTGFFFLKRKSVFTHISLKGKDTMQRISLGM